MKIRNKPFGAPRICPSKARIDPIAFNIRRLSRLVLNNAYKKISMNLPEEANESEDSSEWEKEGIERRLERLEREDTTKDLKYFAAWLELSKEEREEKEAIEIQWCISGEWVKIPYNVVCTKLRKDHSFLQFHYVVREALNLPIRSSSTSLRISFLATKLPEGSRLRPNQIISCDKRADCRRVVRGCQFQVLTYKPSEEVSETGDSDTS